MNLPTTDPSFDPPVVGAGLSPPAAPMRKVIYLNFDGGLLQWCGEGNDDPREDCSTIYQGLVLPYSGDAHARAAVVQSVKNDLKDYDIVLTTERPPDDIEYDMEMIGHWSGFSSLGFAGIAPKIDCVDASGGDTSFTLDYSDYPEDIAKVILQEIAHTWGLEHVDSPADLLYPTTGGAADPRFEDHCSRIVALGGGGLVETGARCPEQHLVHCEDADFQNGHKDILTLFGPAVPDTTPPTISIVSPEQGAAVPESFNLVFEINDDAGTQAFPTTIEIEGLWSDESALLGPGVFPFAVNGLGDGAWTLRVTTEDEAGNLAEATVDVVRGTVEPPAGSTGEETGSEDESSGTAAETEGPSAGPTEDGGCGCGWAGATRGWLALFLVGASGTRGRRRPRPLSRHVGRSA